MGVSDEGELVGVTEEIQKLYKKKNDNFLKNFKDVFRDRIGAEFYPFVDQKIETIQGKEIFVVSCERSESPVFLDKVDFYVRTNPAGLVRT